MSNALLQQIANPFVPDIGGAFNRGQDRARQDRSRNALAQVLGGDKSAMPELLQNDPQQGFQVQQYLSQLDENSRRALAQNTEMAARELIGVAQIQDPQQKISAWQQALQRHKGMGLDTSSYEGLDPDSGMNVAASRIMPIAELLKQSRGDGPIEVSPGATLYDPRTNKPTFTAPDRRSDSKRSLVDKPLPDGTVQKVWVDEGGREIGPFGAPTKPKGAGGGPMPPTIIKALRESREALRAAQNMNKTMEQTRTLVRGKEAAPDAKAVPPLEIDPVDRVAGAVRNYVGAGNSNSQGLQELKRVREKLRSDYLLLSKGVQTEGDANRAMDAMMPDTNDPQVLLNQIDKLEQASQDLQAMHEESVRSIETEYGREPVDLAPLGPPQAPPAAPGGFRVIRRK